MRSIALFVVFLFASTSNALPYWDVQNSGKDVFGNVNVTASSIGDNGNLIRFECGSSSEPFFVFLIRDSTGDIPNLPAIFIHADQSGSRSESDAVLGSWNENYIAVKVTNKDMLRRIAEHMIIANRPISVGVSIPSIDYRAADTFSSTGSTAAGNVLLKHCLSE